MKIISMNLNYISEIYSKFFERPIGLNQKSKEARGYCLEKELQLAEKNKRIGTIFLETLIENGASEQRCAPYANSLAGLERKLDFAREKLEIFQKEGYVTENANNCLITGDLSSGFTVEGKTAYSRTKREVEIKNEKKLQKVIKND